ncbi:Phosphinothricin N-acetyltransferase [Thiomonas sp. X19]|uniref:GNAT family N-acetyltransferase n=1 Tax=Thiomonas sp. X19 TaxID=1050370 RepID=UPI000B730F18|nr:GNAT family N-acetyltransferase [Thiomonas sp. X19]SCC92653.1 Phosphinothricin N-acetyltransferase [Thiomonas sp. X19]
MDLLKTALIRPATEADVAAITHIYRHHVLHGTGTFEIQPPDTAEMQQRLQRVTQRGLPWLVAERDGEVAGFAYANWFREREAYRWTLEDSVYVDAQQRGQGLGSALLQQLLQACEAQGARQLLAVIGDSANEGSIALHLRHGFTHGGVMPAVGWKFGRWLDVVLMQKALGPGASAPPTRGV